MHSCQMEHCVESVQVRSFFWSVSSRIWIEYGDSVRMRENTEQKKLHIWTRIGVVPVADKITQC